MKTNDKIIESLRERREITIEDVLTTEDMLNLMSEIVCEAHNASSEVAWLTAMFKGMLTDITPVSIARNMKFELSKDNIKKLLSDQFNSVIYEYIGFMIKEVGQFVYGVSEPISSDRLEELKKNIENTIHFELKLEKESSELSLYLNMVNNIVRKTPISTEFWMGHNGSVIIYNMKNCTEKHDRDYIKVLLDHMSNGDHPKILISDKASESIYCSRDENGTDVLSKALGIWDMSRRTKGDEALDLITHKKSMNLMKDKYFITSTIRGGNCNVVSMESFIEAIERAEILYTFSTVNSILDCEIGEETVTIKQLQQRTNESKKDIDIISLCRDSLYEFIDKIVRSVESELTKKVKKRFRLRRLR
jgi:hypothetical protein